MRFSLIAASGISLALLLRPQPCLSAGSLLQEPIDLNKRSCTNRAAEEIKVKVARAAAIYAAGPPTISITTSAMETGKETRKVSQQIIILIDQDGEVHVLAVKCIASCFSIGGPDCQLSGCNWYTPGCSACTCTPTEECSESECELIIEDLGSATKLAPQQLLSGSFRHEEQGKGAVR